MDNIRRLYKKSKGKSIGALFVRKALTAFFMNGVVILVGFVTQMFLTRTLGPGYYGDYIYVFSWITILSLFASLGMENTLLKYISSYHAHEEWSLLHGILRFSYFIPLGTSVFICILAGWIAWFLRGYSSESLLHTFWIGCLFIPFYSQIKIRESALRSMMFVVHSSIPQKIFKPCVLIVLTHLFFLYAPQCLNASVVMILDGIAIVIAFILVRFWLHKLFPIQVWKSPANYYSRQWIDVALPFLLLSCTQVIGNNASIIMIGFFMETDQAGIFAIAARIAALISFSLLAVNTIIAPMISKLYTTDRMAELKHLCYIAAWCVFVFSAPVGILFIVFGKALLNVFGETYKTAYATLVILSVAQLVISLTGSVGYIMNMTGNHHYTTRIWTIGMLLNVILNTIFIPCLGVVGAALATFISITSVNLTMCIWIYSHLGINTTIFQSFTIRESCNP